MIYNTQLQQANLMQPRLSFIHMRSGD